MKDPFKHQDTEHTEKGIPAFLGVVRVRVVIVV